MCGIAGFAGLGLSADEARARVRRMCDAIVHRGPDAEGLYADDAVALGMRRLSIIDVAGGAQPMFNEDESVAVVFNGEIYNHHALRAELQAAGHRFRTRSDTEVIVHLYEQYGSDGMARRLHGMFALALWDFTRRRLVLVRDRVGMKPLSYSERDGGILFCSELRSLWSVASDRLELAPASILQFLAFGYVPDPDSVFFGVRKLPPGHLLEWQAGIPATVRRYWAPPDPAQPEATDDELVEELRVRLDAAVASHLESEVPLGAFLSGGLDSSTVVGLMTRHAGGRVRTFSIGFSEADFDESAAARQVAGAFGSEHTELVVSPDVERLFDATSTLYDEPFADSSAIPTLLVSQLARQSVTVALSGDGGDELFGGYSRYREVLSAGTPGPEAVRRVLGSVGLALPHFFPGRNRLIDLGRDRLGRYAATLVQPLRTDEGGIADCSLPGALTTVAQQLERFRPSGEAEDFAAAMMRIDVESYLPGDILTKVDRASMAVSLEARVPLLDFELVDFALALPGFLRVDARESKRLFRRAIRGIVPDAVLQRPKQGFGIPLGRWFRGPLRHRLEALRRRDAAFAEFVDRGAVDRLVREHVLGRRDHGGMLWRLMVLDAWLGALRRGEFGTPPTVPTLQAG